MKRYIYTIFLGFIVGIVGIEFFSLSPVFLHTIFLGIASLLSLYFFVSSMKTINTLFAILFLIAVSIGGMRTLHVYEQLPQNMLQEYVGHTILVQGTIISSIDTREKHSSFIVQLNETHANQKVLVRTQRIHDYRYGDIIALGGTLQTTQVKDKNFALYEASLVRGGVYYRMQYPTITHVGTSTPSQVKHYALTVKDSVYENMNEVIREPVAGLAQGLVLGEKRALSQEWYDTFQRVGMTHIIVLSGYNVAILFAWVIALFFFLPLHVRYTLGVVSVIFLVIISGADAPAIRAGILVVMIALATMLRRQTDAGYFVSIALFGMLLFNPFYLLFDISFQLSALATYGLTYVAPIIENGIKKFYSMNVFTEAFRDTLAAQVMVLPLQIYFFNTVPIIAIFANTILLPFVPLLMVGTIATYFATLISSVMGIFFGSVVTFIGNIFLWGVSLFDSMSTVFHASLSLGAMVCVYLVMVGTYRIIQTDENTHS